MASRATPPPKPRSLSVIPLTIFLLKAGTSDSDALEPEVLATPQRLVVKIDDEEIGRLFVKQTPEHPPRWAKFFEGRIDIEKRELRNASVAAIFLTRAGKRLFALSFGHGRHLLNPNAIEERFGLRVTLNSVDPDLLRAVDITTLEANPFHGKRQAARAAPLGEFGLNLDQDILKAVTGKPLDASLGTQMTGTDSLSVRVRIDLRGVRKLLNRYLAKSTEDTYKKNGFGWVDHVAEVRDLALKEKLFRTVVDQIGADTNAHVWAAIPAVVEWTAFDHFRFGTPATEIDYDDVTLDKLVEALNGATPSLDLLKRKRVFCISKGNPQPVMEWTFLQCLSAEVSISGARYLLNAGTWYRVDTDFAKQVEVDISDIPMSTIVLGNWGDETEAAYNIRTARNSKGILCCMDRVMVSHAGMVSPIEFCDLFSVKGEMIHVKRYGQSSVLSHLFAQGTVAANSALSDAAFRKAANEKLPSLHQFKKPEERLDPSKHEVCFAIGSSEHGRLKLPFFSQVTLRNAYRTLRHSLGFRVSLAKINVSKLTAIA